MSYNEGGGGGGGNKVDPLLNWCSGSTLILLPYRSYIVHLPSCYASYLCLHMNVGRRHMLVSPPYGGLRLKYGKYIILNPPFALWHNKYSMASQMAC